MRYQARFIGGRVRVIMLLLLAGANAIAVASGKVDFTRDVRPILANHCFKCHGPDEATRKGDLRWDLRDEALKPAKSDAIAIVPRKPNESELVARILTEDEDDLMPPPAAKKPLTPEQKEILKRWVAQGAEYQAHWAFVAPQPAPLPKVRAKSWVQNPIDQFVLARLEQERLQPAARADKYTLVRRVYFDLTGLPPTPAQVDEFVNDASPQAYERLVDTLLASPHYGERWARRWLDLARYADTNGYEKDRPRSLWAWRDWVINALNADLPFDQFTRDQLAGDLLPNATREQLIATGLHRNTMLNEEGGIDPLEYRFYSVVDRVHVTSTAWLGLTMACAQCHTHKYDPIQHTEYYQFMAFLNNATEPVMPLPDPEVAAQREKIQAQVSAQEAALPDNFPVEIRVAWQTPGAAEFASEHGAAAEFLSDGSFRVDGGKNPAKDTYTIKFEAAPQRVTHLQLEAIPDEKLKKGGAGNGETGNFVLSELELEVLETAMEPRKVKFASAMADFAQDKFPEEAAIDGKEDTGWSIGGNDGARKHRHVIFALAEPLELKEAAQLAVRLVQQQGKQQTLGRFRVSFGNELPERIITDERRRERRDQKMEQWLVEQLPNVADWKALRPVAATSSAPILTLEADDAVFAYGDYTKSDTYAVTFRELPAGLRAIRLEMLPDERLPNGGPGAVAHEGPEGDFWLSTVKVRADGKAITLTNATESFANGENKAAKAIDADLQSGWSISGGQGKAHNAVFQFAESLTNVATLELEMICEKYYAAGLGRFRVWVTTDKQARATALENATVALLAQHRSPERVKALLSATNALAERAVLLREFTRLAPEYARSRRDVDKLRKTLPKFATTLVMQERPAGNSRATFRHHRGEFLQPKEEVTPGVPAFLPPLPKEAPRNRVALAQWLVSDANPLPGRVIMNRHWEAFFGAGLVRTTEDFGFQGELPSHPELLDWLAVEFRKRGWSQKQMHKLIVMSATYQQASELSAELRERDPLNVLLARGPRFRLEAEMVRDATLVASGLFSAKVGGPSVYPPQPAGVSTEGAYGSLEWKTSEGADRYRRGLYTFAKRTAPYAMTATFDGPSGEACLARRERSNTPLQALTLLNDAAFMECARALGQLAVTAEGAAAKRVELIFRRCLTRPPTPAEQAKLIQFYEVQLARFASGELKASEILEVKEGAGSNEHAAWTTVARVLLNLDETVTKA